MLSPILREFIIFTEGRLSSRVEPFCSVHVHPLGFCDEHSEGSTRSLKQGYRERNGDTLLPSRLQM